MSRARCGDCHGEGVVALEREDPDGRRPSRWVEYGCEECAGCGVVDVDPLADVVACEPDAPEPDAVPVSWLASWPRLGEAA